MISIAKTYYIYLKKYYYKIKNYLNKQVLSKPGGKNMLALKSLQAD